MSFPFDGSFRRFWGGLATSRSVRRAAKRKQRRLQKRHPGYKFEALEPRILLAADPFTLTLTQQISSVEIEHVSATETQVRVTVGAADPAAPIIISSADNDGLLLQGTAGDDQITVTWVESAFDLTNFGVEIAGLGGADTVTLGSTPQSGAVGTWALQSLTVAAEQITLLDNTRVEAVDNIRFDAHATSAAQDTVHNSAITLAGGLVSSAGSVVLDALSSWTFAGAAPAAAFAQNSFIQVLGDVWASTDIDMSAVAQAALDFTATSEILMPADSTQTANIVLGGLADLQGAKVSLTSEAELDLSAIVTPSLADATVTVDVDQSSKTEVASGANITASSTDANALLLDSLVETGLNVDINPSAFSVSEVLGLDVFSVNVDLVRHADVIIGDQVGLTTVNLAAENFGNTARWSAVTLPAETYLSSDGSQDLAVGDIVRIATGHSAGGDVGETYVFLGDADAATLEVAGGAVLSARLSDHALSTPDKGVYIDIQSNLFGDGDLTLDDRAAVRGQNVQLAADSLMAAATANNTSYVSAQFAEISAVGDVVSEFKGVVFGAPTSGVQPSFLSIEALDSAAFRTQSSGFELDGGAGISVVDIEAFGAINSIARSVRASLSGGSVAAEQITVTALAEQTVEAHVDAQSVTNIPAVFPVGGWAFGASYALNSISGGVTASLSNMSVASEGVSTVTSIDVSAVNAMQINSRVEAGSKSIGGNGVAGAGLVSLNVIGSLTAPTERVVADHDDTDTAATLQPDDIVETSEGILYRFLGSTEEVSVNLTTEDFANADRWARIYRRSVEDFLLLQSSGTAEEASFSTEAILRNTDVEADGRISIDAKNVALINATLTNAAVSEAAALFGAVGASAAAVIASNTVQAATRAISDRNRFMVLRVRPPRLGLCSSRPRTWPKSIATSN